MAVIYGRILEIIRDGRRSAHRQRLQLPVGAQGNYATIDQMIRICREDAAAKDIRAWVKRDIIGLDKKTVDEIVNAAFEFSRDKIVYESERAGFETIKDLWSALYSDGKAHGVGDCAIKVTALATILGCYDLKPQFVALRQIKNVEYFNHIYIVLEYGGQVVALDPTPPQFRVGDEANGYQKHYISVFDK